MNYTDLRLKFRRFFKNNRKIFYIIIITWGIIFSINMFLKYKKPDLTPSTTLNEKVSVMDSASSVPITVQNQAEKIIEEYVKYCNEGDFPKAYKLLSEDCRKYEFNDNFDRFKQHVLTKMPTPKRYAIQSYSNVSVAGVKYYIYEVKYTDDYLATGLTNQRYGFTSEKISFCKGEDGEYQMLIGDFLYYKDVKSVSENDYVKIDVVDRKISYEEEEYTIRFTNRSNYTVVIADNVEDNEIFLTLGKEIRKREVLDKVVLKPGEKTIGTFAFPKFIDEADTTQNITFSSVRVMDKYTDPKDADEATIQSEIDNAIAKFSMSVGIKD